MIRIKEKKSRVKRLNPVDYDASQYFSALKSEPYTETGIHVVDGEVIVDFGGMTEFESDEPFVEKTFSMKKGIFKLLSSWKGRLCFDESGQEVIGSWWEHSRDDDWRNKSWKSSLVKV